VDRSETSEETARTPERLVNKLIDDDQVSRSDSFLKRSHRAAAYDCVDAELLEGEDVGRKGHLAGRKRVPLPVAAQKRDSFLAESADQDRRAGPTEGRLHIVTLGAGHMRGKRIAQSRAAYYSYQFFCHSPLLRIVLIATIVIVRGAFTITLSAMKELDMRVFKSSPGLWLLVLLLALLCTVAFFSRATVYEWVFVYYMSYDNDLNSYGKVILRDLQNGVVNSKIALTVQADFADKRGMKRIALYRNSGRLRKKESLLKSEDSADDVQLRKYLEWVHRNWKAKNYCIVFLNHGGTLNNMCLDQKPFRDYSRNKQFGSGKWLRASQAGKTLTSFNEKVDGRVRLLFLQQCGRAAIQNLYSFVDSAEYIMSSPLIVGAPNTYYTETLASVAQDPNITGETLSKIIMHEDEHYTLYTLIRNEQLGRLPEKLKPALDPFALAPVLSRPQSCSPIFEHTGEQFHDLKSYLQALSTANDNIAGRELSSFFSWCETDLIVEKAFRGPEPAESPNCGLSIHVPSSGDPNISYDFLPLYQQTSLDVVTKRPAH
jgi:hypothetical protein